MSTTANLGVIPNSSAAWRLLPSPNGVKFTARNAHATCVFKGKIWVVAGRSDSYTNYNLLTSYKNADVWYSKDGATWVQATLTGDFYAQNIDVIQPGLIAPFYARCGHTLNAIDLNGDGVNDLMVMTGGYAPSPSNDVWVTEDGFNWLYTGTAPWSPRAWHGSVVFQGQLHIMGGTPLNNEVWVLVNVTKIDRVIEPLTRSLFSNVTYDLSWSQLANASWSPRVGMGVVSQFYYNPDTQSLGDSKERIILIGGYGGHIQTQAAASVSLYDGYRCRGDSWAYDGYNWTLLNASNAFGPRAWLGLVTYHGANTSIDIQSSLSSPAPPRLYLFGGGYIGFSTASQQRVTSMTGFSDAWVSSDGANWIQINYQQGGGTTQISFYSTQLWSKTLVDSATTYLGLWGMTVQQFNVTSQAEYPGSLLLIGGDFVGAGDFSANVYRSLSGLFCDVGGLQCSGSGYCGSGGCECLDGYEGTLCETQTGPQATSAAYTSQLGQTAASLQLLSLLLLLWFFSSSSWS